MGKDFKYNVPQLLRLVKFKPCLWDKTDNSYKDREARREAWVEISRELERNYDCMEFEDRKSCEEEIISKWTNVRDTFIRSLRHTSKGNKRKYILHKHLTFLIPEQMKEQFPDDEGEEENYNDDDDSSTSNFIKEEPHIEMRKKRHTGFSSEIPSKRLSVAPVDAEDPFAHNFLEVESALPPRLMNEDEAFFASLLPTVVRYNLEERLKFRMDVLGVMRKINEKNTQDRFE